MTATSHGAMGDAVVGAVDSFPSHAELARTLLASQCQSVMATLTQTGHPYASRAPYIPLADGSPLVCISDLAEHTLNIRRDPRASIIVSEPADDLDDPLALGRVTLIGSFLPYGPDPQQVQTYLEQHPSAAAYVGLDDFTWWRLHVLTARFVGGYGLMGWTSGDELRDSSPDPVLPQSQQMCDHLNDDHAAACLDIARNLAGVADATAATATSIDRYGITLLAIRPDGRAIARVAFDERLSTPAEVRAATVTLAARARNHPTTPTVPAATRQGSPA